MMPLAQLRSAADYLLNDDDPALVRAALNRLHAIFAGYTAVRGDVLEPHHDQDTFLPGGVAISPHLAARCLFDPVRTVQFLRGIYAGIHEAMRRFPGECIHIVYAGCGPYATLLLPLTTQFTPAQIQLTLIDINQPSIDGVRRLIAALGLDDYVHACVQANAITYQHPPTEPLHMVVSETMQAGLAREPQVAIMRNFLPQLPEKGLFLPESIMVEACLSSSAAEDIGRLMHRDDFGYPVGRRVEVERLPLGPIITLNAQTARQMERDWETVPLTSLEIPPHDEQFDQFLLMTCVTVFETQYFKKLPRITRITRKKVLNSRNSCNLWRKFRSTETYGFGPYDCELSFPLRLYALDHVAGGQEIQFSYVFGPKPGLQHQLLPQKVV